MRRALKRSEERQWKVTGGGTGDGDGKGKKKKEKADSVRVMAL